MARQNTPYRNRSLTAYPRLLHSRGGSGPRSGLAPAREAVRSIPPRRAAYFLWVFSFASGSSMHGDASFFCTPAHRSAQACNAGSDTGLFQASQHFPSPTRPGSAVSACLRGGTCCCCFRMRVRGPVHGMQGPWERQKLEVLPKLRTSLERTYAFLGHPSWPKAASRRAMRTV